MKEETVPCVTIKLLQDLNGFVPRLDLCDPLNQAQNLSLQLLLSSGMSGGRKKIFLCSG